jgi:hypothetical protein
VIEINKVEACKAPDPLIYTTLSMNKSRRLIDFSSYELLRMNNSVT